MRGHVRIPGVVDMIRTDSPAAIGGLVAHPKLDRRFEPAGPLLNRILAGRIRRVLQLDGAPLPPVAPRAAPGRAERQKRLEAKLSARAKGSPCSEAHLDELAAHILGRRDPDTLGPLLQEIAGRLFADRYAGTHESWEDARLLDAAVRSFNPFRRLAWALTGAVRKARRRLAVAAGNDPAALHTTGIAVHNLVQSFDCLRRLAAEGDALRRIPAETAVACCLSAPANVFRQANVRGETPAGSLRPGTLVLMEVEKARRATLSKDAAFLTDGWSRCPAHRWVPALMAAAWNHAAAEAAARPPERRP
jgi:hypothetical protein